MFSKFTPRAQGRMVEVNPLKETLLLGVLNVGLPTFDVYSDIGLSAKLYKSTVTIPPGTKFNDTYVVHWHKPTITVDVSHPIFATSLLNSSRS